MAAIVRPKAVARRLDPERNPSTLRGDRRNPGRSCGMSQRFFELPVVWMAVVIFATTYVVAAAVVWCATRFWDNKRGHLPDRGILSPIGVVFGLLVVFTAAQVWGDLERASNAVTSEASALREFVLLGDGLPQEEAAKLRALVVRHIETAVMEEWGAMADGRATLAMQPVALSEALRETLSFASSNETQRMTQREMVEALEKALEARRQRIVISQSTINWVKWCGLVLTGLCVLIGIALVHADSKRNCAIATALFATGMAVSLLLIASHSHPFTGEISVRSDLLQQVARQIASSPND
jgi:Protein of unknown function (DUF4239)